MVIRDNAEELAVIAEQIGAQVIRGAVRYPGREGGFEVGEVDIEELLYELKDQEVVMVTVPSDAATRGATPIPLGLRECS